MTSLVAVRNTILGNGNVLIQSMTDTDTADISATVQQILELVSAGSEIVRIAVDRKESAQAVPYIMDQVRKETDVPIVGDFHFNGHLLLPKYPKMAKSLDKWRINPGNIGKGEKKDMAFETIISTAIQYQKPLRIGVNGGSVDPELLELEMKNNTQNHLSDEVLVNTMVKSALFSAQKAEQIGLSSDKIILSVKHSSVPLMIRAYQSLRSQCRYPLHLGLTEAGGGDMGIVSSSIALGILLDQGIGDTIRVSLTPRPYESRTKEVEICKKILQSLQIRQFEARLVSCPGCGRTDGNDFKAFTEKIRTRLLHPRYKSLHVAVMGCRVNGVGEAKDADIGIFFPGQGEGENAVISRKGEPDILLQASQEQIEKRFWEEVENLIPKK